MAKGTIASQTHQAADTPVSSDASAADASANPDPYNAAGGFGSVGTSAQQGSSGQAASSTDVTSALWYLVTLPFRPFGVAGSLAVEAGAPPAVGGTYPQVSAAIADAAPRALVAGIAEFAIEALMVGLVGFAILRKLEKKL